MLEQMLEKPELLKIDNQYFCSVVIAAAGKGRRMESKVNKVYMDLCGKMAIERTLEAFQDNEQINEIILVVDKNDIEYCESKFFNTSKFSKLKKITGGGLTRQESVYNGLNEVSEYAEIVLIHDGARALVTHDIIDRIIEGAAKYGAVSAGVPVKDTIKVVDNNRFVKNTLERSSLWIVQTPQAFKKDVIQKAHKQARELEIKVNDDAELVERLGYKLKMIEGSYENIKLTTPEDVIVACAIIEDRQSS